MSYGTNCSITNDVGMKKVKSSYLKNRVRIKTKFNYQSKRLRIKIKPVKLKIEIE